MTSKRSLSQLQSSYRLSESIKQQVKLQNLNEPLVAYSDFRGLLLADYKEAL